MAWRGDSRYRVEEHGAVAAREDEAIAVDPLGVLGVVLEEVREEDGSDLLAGNASENEHNVDDDAATVKRCSWPGGREKEAEEHKA